MEGEGGFFGRLAESGVGGKLTRRKVYDWNVMPSTLLVSLPLRWSAHSSGAVTSAAMMHAANTANAPASQPNSQPMSPKAITQPT